MNPITAMVEVVTDRYAGPYMGGLFAIAAGVMANSIYAIIVGVITVTVVLSRCLHESLK